jgi:uncharacterized protein
MKIKGKDYEINLDKVPRENSVIIEGFPGLGFVSTIVCNYLIKHLDAEYIGYIFTKKLLPFATIHQNKIVQPIEIFYDEKNNIVIVNTYTSFEGIEYDIAEIILEFAKKIKAKQIITIEGITTLQEPTEKIYFFTTQKKEEKKLIEKGFEKIGEGIIVGVTGALLLRVEDFPLLGLFVEVHGEMPDNRASALIIKALDSYLGLNIDYRPLLKKAEEIEEKIRSLIEKIKKVGEEKKRRISYTG